ncbi:MarR family winged helix-turn-helix transcriptional regulator [Vineibacter terrae]|uniref:MarR family winged helix-turn-helix transcriptional regulator n=1 Tax=Vineibacter terrae TaxID=2586908 RepID=UPI002E331540|nr:MarR family winged helix-turn-helix transcriptional regulator [Vineibacter terrae]HEX2889379.1 MarR family winged helix-turn-helix transcriptional regulator [Vineibacter terrae]
MKTETEALADRLRPVLQRLQRHLRRQNQAMGTSPLHMGLLNSIAQQEGLGIGELAAQEKLRGPTITAHINQMEAEGWVERRPSADDKRRVGLFITRTGRAMMAAAQQRRVDWLATRLADLPPEGRRAVAAALEPLEALCHD